VSTLVVDDLRFEVRRSARRGSLQITVDRGGELFIAAPEGCPTPVLERFVREKSFWLYSKLAEKDALSGPAPEKCFVNGEGFADLGRSYRLLLVDEQDVPVKLERGRFKMLRSAAPAGREHLVKWYADHARPWLEARVERYRHRLGVCPGGLAVRDLGFRWGSCGKGGRLFFHWRTILLPPRAIEYVVVHELSHLLEPHHTPAFWARVERALPDFAARKRWLAEHGRQASAP
jgi:predicted metal-dependent hydrolase